MSPPRASAFRHPAWAGAGLALIVLAGLALHAADRTPGGAGAGPGEGSGVLPDNTAGPVEDAALGAHREVRYQRGFRFISPLLECESDEFRYLRLRPLKRKLEVQSRRAVQNKVATHISIYFRDLNNGPWVGINEQEEFSPASLMKVPLMMAYFAAREGDRSLFSQELELDFPESYNLEETIKPREQMVRGRGYTVEELIRRMIAYSDNDASELLLRHLGQHANAETLVSVFLDLGLSDPRTIAADDFVTVQEYASFFRILYNASYLSKADSERALEILAQCDFKDGLAAGVPPHVVVAHKFGERSVEDLVDQTSPVRQLHDCGIVYYPRRPYLLCVMTRGADFAALSGVIRDVSKLIYEALAE